MFRKIWNRIRNAGREKALILMYHQVCEKRPDPWSLAVDPEKFEKQLRFLKKKFEVVSLEELVSNLNKKRLRKNMVGITFDDGFEDNYTNAAPLLEWYNLPATFYFATDSLKNKQLYWWDELQSIILHERHLPHFLEIQIGQEVIQFHFRKHQLLNARLIQEINSWTYESPVTNERVALYLKLWERIQPLKHSEQKLILGKLRKWAGLDNVDAKHASVMEEYQMRKMSKNPLFSLEPHTVHHVMLAAHEEAEQRFEIKESKRVIENILGKNITGFAYPYGNYNELTKSLLQQEGYAYAVSTEEGCVTNDADPYSLPRVQVKNWDIDQFSEKIQQLKHQTA